MSSKSKQKQNCGKAKTVDRGTHTDKSSSKVNNNEVDKSVCDTNKTKSVLKDINSRVFTT